MRAVVGRCMYHVQTAGGTILHWENRKSVLSCAPMMILSSKTAKTLDLINKC